MMENLDNTELLIMQFIEITRMIHSYMNCSCGHDHTSSIKQGIDIRDRIAKELSKMLELMRLN